MNTASAASWYTESGKAVTTSNATRKAQVYHVSTKTTTALCSSLLLLVANCVLLFHHQTHIVQQQMYRNRKCIQSSPAPFLTRKLL